jgi:hypothetical protein
MLLTQKIGDTRAFSIPLRWNGRPFVPGAAWHLVFTVKADEDDEDADALFQLETGNGVTVVDSIARVAVPRSVTVDLDAATTYWDVQAEAMDSEEVRTVRNGTLVLQRDITRGRRSTVSGISLLDDGGLLVLDDTLQPLVYT